jgi:hypothetical protein
MHGPEHRNHDECGRPHPCASRQARFYELENMLDEQDVDPADALRVRDELEALRENPTWTRRSQ